MGERGTSGGTYSPYQPPSPSQKREVYDDLHLVSKGGILSILLFHLAGDLKIYVNMWAGG